MSLNHRVSRAVIHAQRVALANPHQPCDLSATLAGLTENRFTRAADPFGSGDDEGNAEHQLSGTCLSCLDRHALAPGEKKVIDVSFDHNTGMIIS